MSQPTACILVIGNEILSGKTQDANIQFLGLELAKLGMERRTQAAVFAARLESPPGASAPPGV